MSAPQGTTIAPQTRRPRADEIDVHGITHVGHARRDNQDHFLIGTLNDRLNVHTTSLPGLACVPVPADRNAFVAAVADGVGGNANGEEASRLTVEMVALYITESTHAYFSTDVRDDAAFTRALEDAALRAHAELLRRVAALDQHDRMATTLTLWFGVWPRVYLLQVGDSRYYIYRDGELRQVSRDQTIAQELVEQGVLTVEDAAHTRWAHVLSSAIGGPQTMPVVTSMTNEWSNVHMLCSDGLTKHVSDERIAERLAHMISAQQVSEALLQDALDGGGSDNITIIVGRAVPR